MTDRFGEVMLGFVTDIPCKSRGSVTLLGLMTGHTMGGFIHALLVITIIVVLARAIQGRRRT
jgi:hypothetical protein